MAKILMYPHNQIKRGKAIFKYNQYRIVHSPAKGKIKKISTG